MMEDQFSGTTDEVRTEPEGLAELLVLSGDALDMEDEDVDPSFDLGSSLKSDKRSYDNFCDKWVTHLNHEDRVSLGLLLCFQLRPVLRKGVTESAEFSS